MIKKNWVFFYIIFFVYISTNFYSLVSKPFRWSCLLMSAQKLSLVSEQTLDPCVKICQRFFLFLFFLNFSLLFLFFLAKKSVSDWVSIDWILVWSVRAYQQKEFENFELYLMRSSWFHKLFYFFYVFRLLALYLVTSIGFEA